MDIELKTNRTSTGVLTPSDAVTECDNTSVKYRWKVLIASIMGYAMDGLDMLILSFVMASVMSTFGLSLAEGGFVATITLFGAVIGGYVFGILADYIGRVKVFSLTILIFSVFTGLTAFASSLTELNIYRFLAGLGLGGEFGIGMTLVTETWPKEKRARVTGGVAIGWQLGVVLAAVVSAWVLPAYGWRAVFLVGALPALFAAWSRYGLAEPAIWIARNELRNSLKEKVRNHEPLTPAEAALYKQTNKFPLFHLFANKQISTTTFGLTVMTSVQNMGYYGIMVWLPTILMQKHGLSLTKTSAWMIATVIGMMLGILVFGYFADKIGRRPAYITFQLMSAASIWIYSGLSDPLHLLVGGAILGFFCNGMMAGYGALLSENYSTDARSTAENFIFNTGRAVGGLAPVIIGILAAKYTLSGALALLAFIYVAAAINVYLLIPETRNKELIE